MDSLKPLAFLLLCWCAVHPATAQDGVVAPDEYVIQAAATKEYLWVQMTGGAVLEFDRASGSSRTVARSGVYDIQRINGRILAMRQVSPTSHNFQLLDLAAGEFLLAEFPLSSAPLLVDAGGKPTLLSQETLLGFRDGEWERQDLEAPLRGWPGINVRSGDGRFIYVGHNHGEWGGGLQGIEVATGRVFEVKGLAKNLDPVTGVIRDASRPDCIIASVGLMHMLARGKILRVCGEQATVIFEEAVPPPSDPNVMALPHKWPFFDLVETSDGWAAISFGQVFRGGQDGSVRQQEIPDLTPWHGLTLATAGPDLIVLNTMLNARHSLSGATPLLVPVTQ